LNYLFAWLLFLSPWLFNRVKLTQIHQKVNAIISYKMGAVLFSFSAGLGALLVETKFLTEVVICDRNFMTRLSENKLTALSQTLFDSSKILFAALVAADFIKFTISIKLLIVTGLLNILIIGLILRPVPVPETAFPEV